MKVYHQTGHNYKWNLDSYQKDGSGDGLIFSPVNIESDRLEKINVNVRRNSFIDPQFYLPKDSKGKLVSYDFFPANVQSGLLTADLAKISGKLAQLCVDFQIDNDFGYVVIPTRYFEYLPSDYCSQLNEYFVYPFINHCLKQKTEKKILLTLIIKREQILDEEHRNLVLNWVTGIQEISGVHIIFEYMSQTKQIKDAIYLFKVMTFINDLKLNGLEVHIGYSNTEGILFSIANPDSISMGSYENLRRFGIKRFITTEKKKQNSPNARLYSGKLYQWIDYGYIEPLKSLYSGWDSIFEDSDYKPLMFVPEFNWHFNKPELYKHFFKVFSTQVNALPIVTNDRIRILRSSFQTAIEVFNEISEAGIYLDSNSDGSHLSFWLTSISMYEKYLKGH